MLLSTIVFLPLAGALLVLLAGGRGDNPEREGVVRLTALAVSLVVFAATLYLWWRSTRPSADFQFVERHTGCRSSASSYHLGVDGISLFLIVLTGFLTPLALLCVVAVGAQERQAVLVLHARARDRDARRVRLARPLPVLHVLGRDAHPDVLPDRDLGLRAAHLRCGQVHPLHDGRQRPDAGRDHRPALRARRRRPGSRASTCSISTGCTLSWTDREVVLPRLRAGLRDQGARSSRSTPGCPTRTSRRRPPARSSSPACC